MSKTMEKSPNPEYPVIVPGVGPIPAKGMIIGEAPGRNEIDQGRPFCGRSGELLNKVLGMAHSDQDEWYVTNLFKGDVGSENRNPTAAEIAAHRNILQEELTTVNPAGILLLGRVATNAFLAPKERMEAIVGRNFPIHGHGYIVFPCWHPAYILRNPSKLEDFKYTVMKFVMVTKVIARHRAEV